MRLWLALLVLLAQGPWRAQAPWAARPILPDREPEDYTLMLLGATETTYVVGPTQALAQAVEVDHKLDNLLTWWWVQQEQDNPYHCANTPPACGPDTADQLPKDAVKCDCYKNRNCGSKDERPPASGCKTNCCPSKCSCCSI